MKFKCLWWDKAITENGYRLQGKGRGTCNGIMALRMTDLALLILPARFSIRDFESNPGVSNNSKSLITT